ncbi:MAG: hypothetical protein ABEH64_00680, partial [Salinirussus sp.]
VGSDGLDTKTLGRPNGSTLQKIARLSMLHPEVSGSKIVSGVTIVAVIFGNELVLILVKPNLEFSIRVLDFPIPHIWDCDVPLATERFDRFACFVVVRLEDSDTAPIELETGLVQLRESLDLVDL